MSEQLRRRRRPSEELQLNENSFEGKRLTDNDTSVTGQDIPYKKPDGIERTSGIHFSEKIVPNQHSNHHTVFCPKCRAKVSEKAVFCGRCGYAMNKKVRVKKQIRKTFSVLFVVLLFAILMTTSLLAMGGEKENAIKRAVWMVNPTQEPTTAQMLTIASTPVVEYVYITPEPQPEVTPRIEYVYITPTPSAKSTPTAKPTTKPTAKPTTKNNSSSSKISTPFTNAYGTSTTRCAVSGCGNYIASSGDTNCCTSHSNRCLECRKYIDGDAMYCMSCIASALYGF